MSATAADLRAALADDARHRRRRRAEPAPRAARESAVPRGTVERLDRQLTKDGITRITPWLWLADGRPREVVCTARDEDDKRVAVFMCARSLPR